MIRPLLRKKASISVSASREIEGHEETLLTIRPRHHRLEGVDVRPSGLVFLLHLDGVPHILEIEMSGRLGFFSGLDDAG